MQLRYLQNLVTPTQVLLILLVVGVVASVVVGALVLVWLRRGSNGMGR